MIMSNVFHRLGDAAAALSSRIQFAWAALIGRLPLPTPFERLKLMTILADIAAIKAAEAARVALDAEKDQAVNSALAAAKAASDKSDALAARLDSLIAVVGNPADTVAVQ
jgi:hypothetical protein